ncbi:MAG TPA: DUF6151 family protein [Luteimonas sp.]|nr:DUF6151 family protein [Luteimonas sp.]
MVVAMRCGCGNVRGEVALARAYTRGTCYCRDCQAYARWLGRAELMDACGGSDIVPMSPAGVRITAGLQHVACMSLSGKGTLRWYAACCRTPLGNTPRSAKLAYLGLPVACLDAAADDVDRAAGRRDRLVLNAGSATCEVRPTPFAFLLGGVAIFAHVVAARLRAPPPSPFVDGAGRRLRIPVVLTAAERDALGANPSRRPSVDN